MYDLKVSTDAQIDNVWRNVGINKCMDFYLATNFIILKNKRPRAISDYNKYA